MTTPSGAFPFDAANFSSLAAFSQKTIADWQNQATSTWELALASLRNGFQNLIAFVNQIPVIGPIAAAALQFVQQVVDAIVNALGYAGSGFTPTNVLTYLGAVNDAVEDGVANFAALLTATGAGDFAELGGAINDVLQLLVSIPANLISGALNAAVTLGGVTLSTLSTNWNAAVTNVNSLISGVSGASTATDVATNINLAATNIAQIGTAAQNAAAGVVGSLNTAATQVQTAFSGILNGLFGGLIGMSAPSGVSQAQAGVALQGVTTNVIGTSTALMAIRKQEAVKAGMISAKFNFADYANGSLPAAFSVVNDNYAGAPAPGGIVIQNGRAVYSPGVSGYASLPAARYTTPMASDYQEISWTSTGDPVFARHAYLRANSSFTTFLRCTIGATVIDLRTVVGGVQTAIASLAYTFKPGARYTLKAGDLSDGYTIYLYENDRLVWTVTDSSHLHQVGASYRYGAFGILGLNDGSTQDYGVDSVLIADQVFQRWRP